MDKQHNHKMHNHGAVEQGHHGHEHHEGHHNHNDHHRMMVADFKKRFWISIIFMIPVLILSPMIQSFFKFSVVFAGSNYVLFALASFIFFYGGWPFLTGLFSELKNKQPGMMTLIAIAISVAYIYSGAVVFGLEGKMFFWELATLVVIMLLGHWVEMKSILGASRALELLVQMLPSEAHLVHGEHIMDVKVEELKAQDIILIKPGEKIPADGTVIEGESYVNESMLTGESRPVLKKKDAEVIGGSLNGQGSIKILIKSTGKDSYLNKVITLVQEAQNSKSKTQHLADRAAKWLTFIALSVGIGTLIVWLALGKDFVFALERMVTVMVIACPHALGLAIPLVVGISTAVSAQNGLLIRNRTAFENSRKISAIVFDKTGTLTVGEFGVSRIHLLQSAYSEGDILSLAASLEQHSEHPIARSIVDRAKSDNLKLKPVKDFKAVTGKGVEGKIDTVKVEIVSPGYLGEKGIKVPVQKESDQDETLVYLMANGELVATIALSDQIREESLPAIKEFKKHGIKVYMATGDNEAVARSVSQKLGLDGYFAQVLPHEKLDIIKDLQSKGEYVAMTGDGVNDAPALAQSNVGIAVGSGTDIAAETADIILVNSNPGDILNLILFGKATYNKMIQNLVWATGYNAFAIPLAAGVLYSLGFVLGPAVGAVFMSLSTVIVAINAQLLKRKVKSIKL